MRKYFYMLTIISTFCHILIFHQVKVVLHCAARPGVPSGSFPIGSPLLVAFLRPSANCSRML